MPERTTAYLGLGGNVGDVATAMRTALERIDSDPDCSVTAVSPVYKTPPWGPVEQDWYLNACAEIETGLEPRALLDLALAVERGLGRVRVERWGPRTLDIDILIYGDEPVELPNLTIPHPRMTERAFVMVPLADIAPERVIGGKTTAEHAEAFAGEPLEKTGDVIAP